MMSIAKQVSAVTVIMALATACSEVLPEPPTFDGESAFAHLARQVEFGPRVPGSEAAAACRGFFFALADSLGIVTDTQQFTLNDPYSGTEIPMTNVILRGDERFGPDQRILLVAHYDSRPRTDYAVADSVKDRPIDGANDGASGVAVLLELARLFAKVPPPCGVDLLLTDGEDWGKPRDHEYYLLGAREFARRGVRDKYRFAVVVDMIGDADQQIFREGYSERFSKPVNDMIWSTAAEMGITSFVDIVKDTILDDHMSLQAAGLSTVVLIDFDYPYWHTEFDTVDKCSPESLANVGRVLLNIIYDPSRWPRETRTS